MRLEFLYLGFISLWIHLILKGLIPSLAFLMIRLVRSLGFLTFRFGGGNEDMERRLFSAATLRLGLVLGWKNYSLHCWSRYKIGGLPEIYASNRSRSYGYLLDGIDPVSSIRIFKMLRAASLLFSSYCERLGQLSCQSMLCTHFQNLRKSNL